MCVVENWWCCVPERAAAASSFGLRLCDIRLAKVPEERRLSSVGLDMMIVYVFGSGSYLGFFGFLMLFEIHCTILMWEIESLN